MDGTRISRYPLENPTRPLLARLASLRAEKTLFVLVSMLDLILTSLLLQTGRFLESNPLADYFYEGWGLPGMAGFKILLVGMILGVINLIGVWRLATARWLLLLGSAVTGGVVLYSTALLLAHYGLL